jgi:hypothetical protein
MPWPPVDAGGRIRPYACRHPAPGRKERKPVKLKLHHLNLCTTDVPAMDAFYRYVLDLAPEPSMNALRVTNQGYGGDVSLVSDGTTQMHLLEQDLR